MSIWISAGHCGWPCITCSQSHFPMLPLSSYKDSWTSEASNRAAFWYTEGQSLPSPPYSWGDGLWQGLLKGGHFLSQRSKWYAAFRAYPFLSQKSVSHSFLPTLHLAPGGIAIYFHIKPDTEWNLALLQPSFPWRNFAKTRFSWTVQLSYPPASVSWPCFRLSSRPESRHSIVTSWPSDPWKGVGGHSEWYPLSHLPHFPPLTHTPLRFHRSRVFTSLLPIMKVEGTGVVWSQFVIWVGWHGLVPGLRVGCFSSASWKT